MNTRPLTLLAISAMLAIPVSGQIATSNEDGATGAYSSEVESSFTAEGRFGPRTAIDDLRADVDRDKETIEKIRMEQLRDPKPAPVKIAPYDPTGEPKPNVEYREDVPKPDE